MNGFVFDPARLPPPGRRGLDAAYQAVGRLLAGYLDGAPRPNQRDERPRRRDVRLRDSAMTGRKRGRT
jgi:hypothetical protein